jgi:glycosyltransferase involved in cell wall biosynthesis
MKILQIATKIPYPLEDGSKIGIFNLTDQFLKHGAKVSFAAPYVGNRLDNQFTSMVDFIPLPMDNKRYTIAGGIRNLFSSLPYNMEKYWDDSAFRMLSDLCRDNTFDAVHVDHLHMARYGIALKEKYGIKVVLREHNFEADIMGRLSEIARNPLLKVYTRLQHSRLLRFESEILRKVDAVLPISEVDERKLSGLVPGVKSFVVPAGVDLTQFVPRSAFVGDRILFLSSYDWLPNIDSLTFFVKEILPILHSKSPHLKTIVAGKATERIPRNSLDSSFEIKGYVKDFNEFSSMASIAVIPLRVGSGIRIKLLELMALGMAIVSTSLGAEGIEVENGKHLLLADTPDEFADRIACLASSPSLCNELGANARELVAEKYTWDLVGNKLMDAYQTILNGHAGNN